MSNNGDHPKEECGVIGIHVPGFEAARLAFFGLFALQHRGQESAGISSYENGEIHTHKAMGLVSQIFTERHLKRLKGSVAIAHNRYSTTGASKVRNAQPITCSCVIGEIAVAHNGNLVNADELRKTMKASGIVFKGTNDSEVIARMIAEELDAGPVEAIRRTMSRIQGAYSCVALINGRVYGFRDPNGVRPLVVGRVATGTMIASESCAFGPLDGKVLREVEPGEIVVLGDGEPEFMSGSEAKRPAICLFEFIYFARPDSVMYDTTLYSARERMGIALAKQRPVDADLVIPVPDSGIPAALGYARQAGLPFREGMMKSRYIHRTFIQPDQRIRELGVRMKLSPLEEHIRGQRVILVDDSIVRATTTNQIVKMLFESGAKEVHVRITAPPIISPCFYGIDMARRNELAAAKWSIEEIRERIGANTLDYLTIEGAVAAVGKGEDHFCLACFNGDYPIPVPEKLRKKSMGPIRMAETGCAAPESPASKQTPAQ